MGFYINWKLRDTFPIQGKGGYRTGEVFENITPGFLLIRAHN